MRQRLQKVIAAAGVSSRRSAEILIVEKRITVNGEIAHVGMSVDTKTDTIQLDGENIVMQKKQYLLLHKPKGYVTTLRDPDERPLISSLISVPERVFPVGRLDIDTSGLIIMTNDGNFSHLISHPKYKIRKRYSVITDKPVSNRSCERLINGFLLEDGFVNAVKVSSLKNKNGVEIDIHFGKNRIVRRMMKFLGYSIVSLVRTNIGDLNLYGLEVGKWRTISGIERDRMIKLANK